MGQTLVNHILDAQAHSVANNIRQIKRFWDSPIFKKFGGRRLMLKELGLTEPFFEANSLIELLLFCAKTYDDNERAITLADLEEAVEEWRDKVFTKASE